MKVGNRSASIEGEVLYAVATHFSVNVDQLDKSVVIQTDLKGDSLDEIEILMRLEQMYSIRIMENEIDECFTLQELIELIKEKYD